MFRPQFQMPMSGAPGAVQGPLLAAAPSPAALPANPQARMQIGGGGFGGLNGLTPPPAMGPRPMMNVQMPWSGRY